MEKSWEWIILFHNWSLRTWLPQQQDWAHVCVFVMETSARCMISRPRQVTMMGCRIDWHGLAPSVWGLSPCQIRPHLPHLAYATFPIGAQLDNARSGFDKDKCALCFIRLSLGIRFSHSKKQKHTHTQKPLSPPAGSPPVVSIKESAQSMS